jgi:hypothetical protein
MDYFTRCHENAIQILGQTDYEDNKMKALFYISGLATIDFSILDEIHVIKAKTILNKILENGKGKKSKAA